MFTRDFFKRTAPWFRTGLAAALALVMAALVFTGCPMGTNDDDDGETWSSIPALPNGWYKGAALPPYDDGYGIEGNVLTYYNNGDKDVAFAGTVESYANNVAVIKITGGGSWNKPVGKYYGVYIGGVTGFSFTGSSAYKDGGNNDGLDSLEAAVAEYTAGSGYFAYQAGYGRYMEAAAITGTTSGLEVRWTAVSGAAGYDVYYTGGSTPPTSTTTAITTGVTITNTTATITGITDLTPHNVWVRAKDAAHTGAWVYQGSGTPDLAVPANLAGYFQSLPFSPDYAFYDDGLVVDASAKTFYYYSDSTFNNKWGGPIVKIVPDGDAFIMIVKIAQVTGAWYSPPETGKYFAAAYKNLTESAVNSNTAYKATGNNSGTATITEAVSEYTIANGYFDYLDTTQYYPHTASAETLASVLGDWHWEDNDYYIQIKGTKLTEWLDDGDGIYNAVDDESMLGELGDIVDHTDTSRAAGVLYVRIIASDMAFAANKYIAVAWKDKAASSVSFATGTTGYDTLMEVKAARNDPDNTDQFPAAGFHGYIK
ncbi:MAG: hypothetical protein LBH70_00940 [Spirochaetaceae bacterium]|jgi:hypothetical protein|nr:hypothetical protein [Spirochaetaceae bacterium]